MNQRFLGALFFLILSCGSKNVDSDREGTIKKIAYFGLEYLKQGNLIEAEKRYDSVHKLDSNSEAAVLFKSEIYKYKGMYDSALRYNSIAIKLSDKKSSYYGSRAVLYFELGKLDSALKDIQIAYKLDSNNVRICDSYASFLSYKGDFKTALLYSFKSLSLDSSRTSVYYDIAILYSNQKKYDTAVYYCSRGLILNPLNIALYRLRGECYINSDNKAQGCLDLKNVIELSKERDIEVEKALIKFCK